MTRIQSNPASVRFEGVSKVYPGGTTPAVDAISFTYAGVDGAPRMVGPWGGSGGQEHKVRSICSSCSSFAHHHDVCIS